MLSTRDKTSFPVSIPQPYVSRPVGRLRKNSPSSLVLPTLQQTAEGLNRDPEPALPAYQPWIKPKDTILTADSKRSMTALWDSYNGLYAPPLKGWKQISSFMGVSGGAFRAKHGKELTFLNILFKMNVRTGAFARPATCAWPSDLILWTHWKAHRREII